MSDNRIGRNHASEKREFRDVRLGFMATQRPTYKASKVMAEALSHRPEKPPSPEREEER